MFFINFFLVLVLLGPTSAGQLPHRPDNNILAPLYGTHRHQDLVPDSYIVRLIKNYTLASHFARCGVDLSRTSHDFEEIPILRSYRARLDNFTVNQLVRTDPGVEYVEHDFYIEQPSFVTNDTVQKPDTHPSLTTPNHLKRWRAGNIANADYALHMITAGRRLDAELSNYDVRTLRNPGTGVNAYVLDTGVSITHNAFGRRASNFRGMRTTPYCASGDLTMSDHIGHGTNVASLIAGGSRDLSISFANIINTKIWCSNRAVESRISEAIADITADHRMNVLGARKSGFKGSIINLSVGISDMGRTLRTAIEDASEWGVVIVVAAPNMRVSASIDPLCSHPSTICVASCTQSYQWVHGGAYGPGIQIIAPGRDLLVARRDDDETLSIMSGTSMAAPIVASVLTNFIGYEGIMRDSEKVRRRMFDNSLPNIITDVPENTSNLFINIPTNGLRAIRGPPYIGAPLQSLRCARCFTGRSNGFDK
ncbi:subtilisin-like protein [Viridothelium virens]|uniref:Subtilisin-like protein n=1 Tax=Viridothelium virens TaxID=1048519 RepID=A0A6A6H443_VIRVR|nr:subtilisin-like protein [Viridothelium virens]